MRLHRADNRRCFAAFLSLHPNRLEHYLNVDVANLCKEEMNQIRYYEYEQKQGKAHKLERTHCSQFILVELKKMCTQRFSQQLMLYMDQITLKCAILTEISPRVFCLVCVNAKMAKVRGEK